MKGPSGAAGFSKEWVDQAPPDDIKTVDRVSARWLGIIPIGYVDVGLAGLRFVGRNDAARTADLRDGVEGLRLPMGSVLPQLDDVDLAGIASPYRPKTRNLTIDMVMRVAASPGFQGHLSDRRHAERVLFEATMRAPDPEGGDLAYGGFIALGRDRLCFFGDDQSGWAAALGEELSHLTFMDGRLSLLRSCMLWLDAAGWDAAVARMIRYPFGRSYDRAEVERSRAPGLGLRLGTAGEETDVHISGDDENHLAAWLRAR